MQIHTVELGKLHPLDTDPAARHDPLVVFARFLTAHSDHALAELAEESPAMKQAVDILEDLSQDADVRRLAADREARLKLDAMYQAGALRKAREEGRASELTEAILTVLATRFGSVPPDVRSRIEAADLPTRRALLARALTAASLAELLQS